MAVRATDRACYDADVLVIGAGPAGLSAALRVRWVKGYHAMPASVVVFDPGPPGGLLRGGGCVLTGPAWSFTGEDLNTKLKEDLERLRIPVIRARVVSIRRADGMFHVTLAGGSSWTGRAVILATGFRAIGEEGDHYLSGVRITYKGYDYFPSLLAAAAREAGGRGLLVVGHERTAHMVELLRAHTLEAGGLTMLLEDLRGTVPESLRELGRIELGRLAGIEVDEAGRVTGARMERSTEGTGVIPCGAILLDYNAFELRPALEIGGLLPPLDRRGFVKVDAFMRTGIDGLFAAGDVTGRYAATLVALGDGVTAGFSAYRYVFRGKFGEEPRLFAYRATDRPMPSWPRDLPLLPDDAVPVVVGDRERVRASSALGAAIDERTDVGTLRARFGIDPVDQAMLALLARKEIAVHRARWDAVAAGRDEEEAGGSFHDLAER